MSVWPANADVPRSIERMRMLTITHVFGPLNRLNLREVGVQWGEGEWTARDLWDKP